MWTVVDCDENLPAAAAGSRPDGVSDYLLARWPKSRRPSRGSERLPQGHRVARRSDESAGLRKGVYREDDGQNRAGPPPLKRKHACENTRSARCCSGRPPPPAPRDGGGRSKEPAPDGSLAGDPPAVGGAAERLRPDLRRLVAFCCVPPRSRRAATGSSPRNPLQPVLDRGAVLTARPSGPPRIAISSSNAATRWGANRDTSRPPGALNLLTAVTAASGRFTRSPVAYAWPTM